MSKKIIQFSAQLNTGDFEKAFAALNKKIESMAGPYRQSKASTELRQKMQSLGLAAPSDSDSAKMRQQENLRKRSLMEVEKEAQKHFKAAERLEKLEEKKKQRLEQMRRIQTVSFDEEIKHKQKILKLEQDILKVSALRKTRMGAADAAANEFSNLKQNAPNSSFFQYQAPGVGDRYALPFGMGSIGGGAARVMGVAGLGLAGGTMFANRYQGIKTFMADTPLAVRQSQGAALTGGAQNYGTSAIFDGSYSNFAMFSPERRRAMAMTEDWRQKIDPIRAMSEGEGQGAFDVLMNARTIGGGQGMWAATKALFGSDQGMKDLESLTNAAIQDRMASSMAAERANSPLKIMAEAAYRQQVGADYSLQKGLGIGDSTLRDSIYGANLNSGISRDEILSSISTIIGAGGSTEAGRSLGGLAARAERSGLSNSASSIGVLSGLMGDSSRTEESYKRLLAEGVKRGLNDSEFTQENIKFQEMLVNAVSSAGLSGSRDVDLHTSMIGNFLQNRTSAGVSAAQSAYGTFSGITSGGQGINAMVRGAGMMGEFGKYLDFNSMNYMVTSDISKITPGNPAVSAAFEEAKSNGYGGSIEEFVSSIRQQKGQSALPSDHLRSRQAQIQAEEAKLASGDATPEQKEAISRNLSFLKGKMQQELVSENTRVGSGNLQDELAYTGFMSKGEYGTFGSTTSADSSAVDQRLARGTPSLGQKELEGLANQQDIVNTRIRDMTGELEKAAIAAKALTDSAMEMHLKLSSPSAYPQGQGVVPSAGKTGR